MTPQELKPLLPCPSAETRHHEVTMCSHGEGDYGPIYRVECVCGLAGPERATEQAAAGAWAACVRRPVSPPAGEGEVKRWTPMPVHHETGEPWEPGPMAEHFAGDYITYEDHVSRLASALRKARGEAQAASEYDRAVEALAPYLPDGWVVQDGHGVTDFYAVGDTPVFQGFWSSRHIPVPIPYPFEVPVCEGGSSASLRRIQGGRVSPESPKEAKP